MNANKKQTQNTNNHNTIHLTVNPKFSNKQIFFKTKPKRTHKKK